MNKRARIWLEIFPGSALKAVILYRFGYFYRILYRDYDKKCKKTWCITGDFITRNKEPTELKWSESNHKRRQSVKNWLNSTNADY